MGKPIVEARFSGYVYRCKVCEKDFTDDATRIKHFNSKEHDENRKIFYTWKKLGKKERSLRLHFTKSKKNVSISSRFHFQSFSGETSEKELGEHEVVEKEKFNRKKFKTRPDSLAFDLISSYVYSLVSYLTIKLSLDPNIDDIQVSVNDKRYQSFGDAVVTVTHKETENLKGNKKTTYAIRCKHVSASQKQIDDLKDAKIYLEKDYMCIKSLKNLKDFEDIKFLIFTTCNTAHNFKTIVEYSSVKKDPSTEKEVEIIKRFSLTPSKKNYIINVSSDSDNIFTVTPEDKELVESKLPSVFIYTNQKISFFSIDNFIKRKFPNYHNSILKNYNRYIENWAKGDLGGNYKLSKKDVILKLGELLLQTYIIVPKIVNFKNDNFSVWNSIVEKVDVIIVKTEPFLLSKLCEPFNKTIETSLNVKFDPITKTLKITEQNMTDPEIKAYLFEENDLESEIHLSTIYRVFWKAGKIPLLLSLENNEDSKGFIFDVISFLKTNGVNKKFLLKSEVAFQHFKKPPDNLRIFSCLKDVEEYVDLSNLKITVKDKDRTGEMYLSLKQISSSDPFILKWVTPSIFFDIVLDRYTLRKDESLETDIQSEMKIILDDETRREVHRLLYKCDCLEENLGRLMGIDPKLV